MSTRIAIAAIRRERERERQERHAGGLQATLLRIPALLGYAVLGAVGVLLWLVMHLPLGERARSGLVYAMAGCVGLFTIGWRMLRAQAVGVRD